jgi:putative membrane protein
MPSPWRFSFEPAFVVLAAVAVVLYVRAWRREPGAWWRAASFAGGIVLVLGALNSPLGTIATEYLVLFHLLQNVMISDWAPPLLVIGLTPAMRTRVARFGGRPFAWLTRPQVALPVWLVGWYVVHLGSVYDAAVRDPFLLALEHAFLIAIGLLFWWPVLCDVPHTAATLTRIGYVFAAFVLSAFLGLALTFSPPIYDYYESLPDRLWGIGAEKDQNLGGILMSSEQALVFFAAIVWLLVRLFREEAEAEERLAAEQRAAGLREH